MALQAAIALEVKKNAKFAADLANEKAAKNALQVDIKHQNELHEATVTHLNECIDEFKSDKMQYMDKVLGGPPASQSVRTVQNTRLDSQGNTPTDARHDHGRYDSSGSAHSPAH